MSLIAGLKRVLDEHGCKNTLTFHSTTNVDELVINGSGKYASGYVAFSVGRSDNTLDVEVGTSMATIEMKMDINKPAIDTD